MAFNPFGTFQKNKRFWMAAILIICMITFVFLGFRGGLDDRISKWTRGSQNLVQIGGQNYTSKDLHDLKTQRNLANSLMIRCSDMAFKKLSARLFEDMKKPDLAKGQTPQARAEMLQQMEVMKETLAVRKGRTRFFDGGVKFDDLCEFIMWRAVADRLDIRLEEDHVNYLFRSEFFSQRGVDVLSDQEIDFAQRDTLREFRDANNAYVRRAISDEFRVRIAQLAVMEAQPWQFFMRKRRESEGFALKFTNPDMPDEIRSPLTLAQLWDTFKAQRAEFDVTLFPIAVDDFVKKLKEEPNEIQKADFFKANRDKANDPSLPDRGLQLPTSVKIAYVTADPSSPAYLGLAKTVAQLKQADPIALDAVQFPIGAAVRQMAIAQMNKDLLQQEYESLGKGTYHSAALISEKDCVTPILAWMAGRHPEAVTSWVGAMAMAPGSPLDSVGATAGYLAWGQYKHPAEVDAAIQSEMDRRASLYATLFLASATQFPLDMAAPFLTFDKTIPLNQFGHWAFLHPQYTLETVKSEIQNIGTRRAAEEHAQQNMQIIRTALEKAGDDSEKIKRELKKYVPELNLTVGPGPDLKSPFLNRYTVDQAKELEPLKEAYLKYMDMINFFEGRDMTPERLLKPTDFYKLFFESTEPFAATALNRAMPWPPKVKSNNARLMKRQADPRLINRAKMDERDLQNFFQQLGQADPLRPLPEFDDLYKNAAKPILFWRTDERLPPRPGEYADIARNLAKIKEDSAKIEGELKKLDALSKQSQVLRKKVDELRKAKADAQKVQATAKDLDSVMASLKNAEKEAGGPADLLRKKLTGLQDEENDLKEIERLVIDGWKFEQARNTQALPKAKDIAKSLIDNANLLIGKDTEKIFNDRIPLDKLSVMHPEDTPGGLIDYFPMSLPKDKISYPRDDMMQQVVSLYDLKSPIKTGAKELDEINEELFKQVQKLNRPEGKYVQILTNKPRSVFYVAIIARPPGAELKAFAETLVGAPVDKQMRFFAGKMIPPDNFVFRVQHQQARLYRQEIVNELRKTLDFKLEREDAKKDFDERGGD